jgi:hypothetical protein
MLVTPAKSITPNTESSVVAGGTGEHVGDEQIISTTPAILKAPARSIAPTAKSSVVAGGTGERVRDEQIISTTPAVLRAPAKSITPNAKSSVVASGTSEQYVRDEQIISTKHAMLNTAAKSITSNAKSSVVDSGTSEHVRDEQSTTTAVILQTITSKSGNTTLEFCESELNDSGISLEGKYNLSLYLYGRLFENYMEVWKGKSLNR